MKVFLVGWFAVLVSGLLISLVLSWPTQAATWVQDGVAFGNICADGVYFTIYPVEMGQPIGSACPIRDQYGRIFAWGVVVNQ